MTFKHGKNAKAYYNGYDLTGYLRGGELTTEVDTADTTVWGSTWKTAIAGLQGASYALEGLFDAAAAPIFTTDLAGTSGVLTVCPSGAAAGDMVRMMQVIKTTYAETSPVGDVVGFTFGALSDTVPGFGHVISALTAQTTDNNGASVDLTAQTTTGGIAHLHVTGVSSADSIVCTIEDSSTGSSGWATIGTFASKSAIGAERIVIAGTIKRYVRAVFDVTGTSVSIPAFVTLART